MYGINGCREREGEGGEEGRERESRERKRKERRGESGRVESGGDRKSVV